MAQSERHYHRKAKSKGDKGEGVGTNEQSAPKGNSDKKTRVTSDKSGNTQSAREIEEGSKLHMGDTTLQTPEEHQTDADTDQTKTDRTEVPRG
jgi:hypothetical protein